MVSARLSGWYLVTGYTKFVGHLIEYKTARIGCDNNRPHCYCIICSSDPILIVYAGFDDGMCCLHLLTCDHPERVTRILLLLPVTVSYVLPTIIVTSLYLSVSHIIRQTSLELGDAFVLDMKDTGRQMSYLLSNPFAPGKDVARFVQCLSPSAQALPSGSATFTNSNRLSPSTLLKYQPIDRGRIANMPESGDEPSSMPRRRASRFDTQLILRDESVAVVVSMLGSTDTGNGIVVHNASNTMTGTAHDSGPLLKWMCFQSCTSCRVMHVPIMEWLLQGVVPSILMRLPDSNCDAYIGDAIAGVS